MVYRLGRSLVLSLAEVTQVSSSLVEKQCGFFPCYGTVDQLIPFAGLLGGSWEFDHPVAVFFWTWKGPMTMSPRDPVGSRGYVFLAQSQICL